MHPWVRSGGCAACRGAISMPCMARSPLPGRPLRDHVHVRPCICRRVCLRPRSPRPSRDCGISTSSSTRPPPSPVRGPAVLLQGEAHSGHEGHARMDGREIERRCPSMYCGVLEHVCIRMRAGIPAEAADGHEQRHEPAQLPRRDRAMTSTGRFKPLRSCIPLGRRPGRFCISDSNHPTSDFGRGRLCTSTTLSRFRNFVCPEILQLNST